MLSNFYVSLVSTEKKIVEHLLSSYLTKQFEIRSELSFKLKFARLESITGRSSVPPTYLISKTQYGTVQYCTECRAEQRRNERLGR